MGAPDLGHLSMFELFRLEADSQLHALADGLLALERDPRSGAHLEGCMRAAHSLKGAARIVGIQQGVEVAHAMEDCLVAAQRGELVLTRAHIDALLQGADLLERIAAEPEATPEADGAGQVRAFVETLAAACKEGGTAAAQPGFADAEPEEKPVADFDLAGARSQSDASLRVTARHLNQLLGLAGEVRVDARRVQPFAQALLRTKRLHQTSVHALDRARELLAERETGERLAVALDDAWHGALDAQRELAQRLVELDATDRRGAQLSRRLYEEALAVRMRPFGDGVRGFPRIVRDLAQALGKRARLEIVGAATPVDRDVLEKLETPLVHLLRNALAHGIETADERRAYGKPPEGALRLEARHHAGLLEISVADDGRGIDLDRLRASVVERGLTNAGTAAQLSETELLDFLFLPGFSLSEQVTEIAGRGVGLDAVAETAKQLRGSVRVSTLPGRGTRFVMLLPLTVSVVRALLVEIGGEPYAFALAQIVGLIKLPAERIDLLEGHQHFDHGGTRVGLVDANQVLETGRAKAHAGLLPVLVIGDAQHPYGLVVDRFLGACELVVQPLDPRLGKVTGIAAGALLEDGAPVLIADIDDLVRLVEKLVAGGRLGRVEQVASEAARESRKRVLIVEDSLTVRELERKLIAARGYDVEVAVDGMDGWNALRGARFDLVVTDVDMPRLDGIELVRLIRRDAALKSLPVLIVSYKERAEDRERGLDAGADAYLTKGSFHDETLIQTIVDAIGEPA